MCHFEEDNCKKCTVHFMSSWAHSDTFIWKDMDTSGSMNVWNHKKKFCFSKIGKQGKTISGMTWVFSCWAVYLRNCLFFGLEAHRLLKCIVKQFPCWASSQRYVPFLHAFLISATNLFALFSIFWKSSAPSHSALYLVMFYVCCLWGLRIQITLSSDWLKSELVWKSEQWGK